MPTAETSRSGESLESPSEVLVDTAPTGEPENDQVVDTLVDTGVAGMKWVSLACVCLFMTAEYYSIDIPAVLHQDLKDYMEGSSSSSDTSNFEMWFNLLYTVYSLPNIILPLIGGFAVDRFGPTLCMIGYSSCLLLGQSLFAIGSSHKSWKTMLVGRAIFGLGGEAICVANSTLLTKLFDVSERAFAFGALTAIARLGSVLNSWVSPKVAHARTTPWALGMGALFQAGGLLSACLVHKMNGGSSLTSTHHPSNIDAPDERRFLGIDSLSQPLLESAELESIVEVESLGRDYLEMEIVDNQLPRPEEETTTPRPSVSDVAKLCPTFWTLCLFCLVFYACVNPFNNVASGILLERNYFQQSPMDCQLKYPSECTAGRLAVKENPSLDASGQECPGPGFAPVLPTLPLNSTRQTHYMPFYPMEDTTTVDCEKSFWAKDCTRDYCNALHSATEKAGATMSIPYALSAILSAPVGKLVDRVGRRVLLLELATLMLLAVHSTLAFVSGPAWIPFVGQGIAYTVFNAVLWPSIGMVVKGRMTGLAYGICLSLQNMGLALFPVLVAALYNASHQRFLPNVEILFVSCASVGILVGMMLWVLDRRNGDMLNKV